jgi:CO/xanthine dehydrogenase Mo-binding subunit
MTHAFVLRSPVAHARIKRIDAAAARRMPGELFVATGEDEPLPAVSTHAFLSAKGLDPRPGSGGGRGDHF